MNGAIAGPVLAGAVGVLVSYIEVYNKRGAAPRRDVAGWVVLRLSVDASMAAGVFPAAMLIVASGQWWWASVASGVAAPIVIRSQVTFVGRGGHAKDFGPGVLYRKLRSWVDGKIDRQTSSKDAAWVINVVAPMIARIPERVLKARIEGYYTLWEHSQGVKQTAQLTYIRKMFDTRSADSGTVHEAIVFQLLSYGHRELVLDLLAEGRTWTATVPGAGAVPAAQESAEEPWPAEEP